MRKIFASSRSPAALRALPGISGILALSVSACSSVMPSADKTPPSTPARSTEISTSDAPSSLTRSPITPTGTEPHTPPAASLPPLPPPTTFEDAVRRAGEQLLADAQGRLDNEERTIVIDPLIDASTGAQTLSTVSMGEQLSGLIQQRQPHWKLQTLSRASLATQPLLLIGTLTPVHAPGTDRTSTTDIFRVWLTLIDLRTGRIVAKSLDRAKPESVNAEPVAYFRDSPTWHKDRTVAGYINACQIDTRPGDLVNADYLTRLPAAAVTQEAIQAYNEGRHKAAYALYREAQPLADPADLRVLNGLYLTSWRLGDVDTAAMAFRKIVEVGLQNRQLPIKLLFQPGGTQLLMQPDLQAQYALWLKELAAQAHTQKSCIKVVGHTSRTGPLPPNEALSLRRASVIEHSLVKEQGRSLGRRLSSDGVGWRDNLIGLGTDDMRDVLDRRVEFRVVDCQRLSERAAVGKANW